MDSLDGKLCPCFVEKKCSPEEEATWELMKAYHAAVGGCFSPVDARERFGEYDGYREIFIEELESWLGGSNPREVKNLEDFAWKVQGVRISEGVKNANCLDWDSRKQRAHLGDGLLEYLGLLESRVKGSIPER